MCLVTEEDNPKLKSRGGYKTANKNANNNTVKIQPGKKRQHQEPPPHKPSPNKTI
jgi:hypothetical protein